MEIIEHSHHEMLEAYAVTIMSPKGWGYYFDSNAEGEIFFPDGRPFDGNPAWANLNYAIDYYCRGEYFMDLEDNSRDMFIPTLIRCTENMKVVVAEKRGNKVTKLSESYEPCNEELYLYGDTQCECGQWYNSFGQRLRDNWMDNRSNWDDDCGDLEGYEMAELRREYELEWMEEV
jgi:hypothetical protein